MHGVQVAADRSSFLDEQVDTAFSLIWGDELRTMPYRRPGKPGTAVTGGLKRYTPDNTAPPPECLDRVLAVSPPSLSHPPQSGPCTCCLVVFVRVSLSTSHSAPVRVSSICWCAPAYKLYILACDSTFAGRRIGRARHSTGPSWPC